MRFIIDMNLPPAWCAVFQQAGHQAEHWINVGNPQAEDREIMEWARINDAVVFSHDLDFSALLASSRAGRPSVIQVRAEDIMPEALSSMVLAAIQQHADALAQGALVVIEPWRSRCRILPLQGGES